MIILYSIVQLILLPFLFLPLVAVVLLVPKYRMRTLRRLGIGLVKEKRNKNQKTIWVHALSVGEVTSALPLISGLRKELPEVLLVFSASTRAGAEVAEKLLHDKVDRFIPFPFDILPVIKRFTRVIQPDLFILVETDFWPGMLSYLKQQHIPSLLVNGRISEQSMQSYKRFSFFFRPLFASFQTLSMQTERDKDNLITLGVDHRQIETLGNLKYDTALYSTSRRNQPISFSLPPHEHLLVAGSTHEGEEKILLQSYKELKEKYPNSYMIIAPRDINRGKEIQDLAATLNLQANCRSQINAGGKDFFILDTIGELNKVYSHADIAFVGGSLVTQGGHNPIEPAIFAIPVLFGPHMEDFSEISDQLIQAGGAIMVRDSNELVVTLHKLLPDSTLLQETGEAAKAFIISQQGVIKRHLKLIKEML
jgi:3-deoxy-D-manno-octulosonic-acid transferase